MKRQWIVWMIALSMISGSGSLLSQKAEAAPSPTLTVQPAPLHIDWCFDWSAPTQIVYGYWIGPVLGEDSLPQHNYLVIPVGTYSPLGCKGYTFWLSISWDTDTLRVANIQYYAWYSDVNALLDAHNDQTSISLQDPYGDSQSTINADGHVTDCFCLKPIDLGMTFESYPHISVNIYADGSYYLNARWV